MLQDFLALLEPTVNQAFIKADVSYFMTASILTGMRPIDRDKQYRVLLRRLLVIVYIWSVNTPKVRTSLILKPFATYQTSLIFLGLINAFFSHLFKPIFDATSTLPYHQQLAQFLRGHDACITEAVML